jgi:hypothetical protein
MIQRAGEVHIGPYASNNLHTRNTIKYLFHKIHLPVVYQDVYFWSELWNLKSNTEDAWMWENPKAMQTQPHVFPVTVLGTESYFSQLIYICGITILWSICFSHVTLANIYLCRMTTIIVMFLNHYTKYIWIQLNVADVNNWFTSQIEGTHHFSGKEDNWKSAYERFDCIIDYILIGIWLAINDISIERFFECLVSWAISKHLYDGV